MDRRRMLGDSGERAAVRALSERGMTVVAQNVRTRFGEIDLVCRDRQGYVFVEVKTRTPGSFVAAAEAVSSRKLRRLERLAASWLAYRGERGVAWRLELVAITGRGDALRVEHVPIDRAAR